MIAFSKKERDLADFEVKLNEGDIERGKCSLCLRVVVS